MSKGAQLTLSLGTDDFFDCNWKLRGKDPAHQIHQSRGEEGNRFLSNGKICNFRRKEAAPPKQRCGRGTGRFAENTKLGETVVQMKARDSLRHQSRTRWIKYRNPNPGT